MIEQKTNTLHQVRSYECDYYGHVNNAVYLNYLEWGRFQFLEERGLSLQGLREAGLLVVIHRIAIDYKGPSKIGDHLVIETRLESYRKVSGIFKQNIFLEENHRLLTQAQVHFVFLNLDEKPARIPLWVRKALGME